MHKQDILTELLLDDSFKAWVLSDEKENHLYWQRWMKMHPDQLEVLNEAKKVLFALREDQLQLPDERKNALRQKIVDITRSVHPNASPADRRPILRKRQVQLWPKIAAAVLVLVACSWLFYTFAWHQTAEMQYTTAYGEIKTLVLPDSSVVTLNGNSSIKYTYRQDASQQREVWLEGEGFFEVNKKKIATASGQSQPVKFIVHTDNLSVKVLGTRFNVRHRREQTQVVLEEGSIELDLKAQEDPLRMVPDEMVEVKKGEKVISQKVVKAGDYIAWKEGILNFDGASFSEISTVLKDNYGLELHFVNKSDADHINLRGTFPAENMDILLEAIANITQTTIKKEGKKVIYQ
jgi:ferric-dicitrate binding protein FerR (iron transport regulator)